VGERTLTNALAYSDNSVFAEVGLKVGTPRIAHVASEMGITTPISTNDAMTIGGLKVGVTPLDMAHAYETLAEGGERISGTLAARGQPDVIESVNAATSEALLHGRHSEVDRVHRRRVLPSWVAATETSMLETVLQYGTARDAALEGQFAAGKTGTTTNYADAWFVGWNSRYTVAVWVGYPNKLVPMNTQYDGGPVLGGTFPALIWHDFMVAADQIEEAKTHGKSGTSVSASPGVVPESGGTAASSPAPTAPPATSSAPATAAQSHQSNPTGEHHAEAPAEGRPSTPETRVREPSATEQPAQAAPAPPATPAAPETPATREAPAAHTEVPAPETRKGGEAGNTGGTSPPTGGTPGG
jgi:penicillin-binding protein 1A